VSKAEAGALGLLILVLVFYYALAKWGHKLPDIFGDDKK